MTPARKTICAKGVAAWQRQRRAPSVTQMCFDTRAEIPHHAPVDAVVGRRPTRVARRDRHDHSNRRLCRRRSHSARAVRHVFSSSIKSCNVWVQCNQPVCERSAHAVSSSAICHNNRKGFCSGASRCFIHCARVWQENPPGICVFKTARAHEHSARK